MEYNDYLFLEISRLFCFCLSCINNVKPNEILQESVFALAKTCSTSAGSCYKTVDVSRRSCQTHTHLCTARPPSSRPCRPITCLCVVFHHWTISVESVSVWLLVILLVLWYCFVFVTPWREAEQGSKGVFPMTYTSTTTNHTSTRWIHSLNATYTFIAS